MTRSDLRLRKILLITLWPGNCVCVVGVVGLGGSRVAVGQAGDGWWPGLAKLSEMKRKINTDVQLS